MSFCFEAEIIFVAQLALASQEKYLHWQLQFTYNKPILQDLNSNLNPELNCIFFSCLQFGSSSQAVFFKMRVAGVLHIFQFDTKQGEDICMALQTHINDIMMKRYSKVYTVDIDICSHFYSGCIAI